MNMWWFGTFIRIEVKPKVSNSNYRWHSVKFVIIESRWFFILILSLIADIVVCYLTRLLSFNVIHRYKFSYYMCYATLTNSTERSPSSYWLNFKIAIVLTLGTAIAFSRLFIIAIAEKSGLIIIAIAFMRIGCWCDHLEITTYSNSDRVKKQN